MKRDFNLGIFNPDICSFNERIISCAKTEMHENLPVFSDENASIMLAVLNQSFSRMHTRMYALTQRYKFTGYDDWC